MFFSAGIPSSRVCRKFSSRTEFWMALAAKPPCAMACQIAGHTAVVMRVPMPSRGHRPQRPRPLVRREVTEEAVDDRSIGGVERQDG